MISQANSGVTGTNSVVQVDGLAFVTTFRVHPSVPAPALRVRQTLFGCEGSVSTV